MNRKLLLTVCCVAGVGLGAGARGAPPQATAATNTPAPAAATRPVPQADPLSEFLFPPELALRAAQEIGLDPATQEAIRTEITNARTKLEAAQQQLRTDTGALGELLRQESPDAAKCLAALDKVLDDERAIKEINLGLVLTIKGQLTGPQAAQLMQLRDKLKAAGGAGAGGAIAETLRAKMQEVQTLAQKKMQEGADLTDVRQLMQDARTEVQDGKYKEAEEALDQALKLLL